MQKVFFQDESWFSSGGIALYQNGGSHANILYLKKHWLRPGVQDIHINVKGKPVSAGIDPYGKLLDPNKNDNMKNF